MIASAGAAAPPIAVVTGLALEARVAAGLGVVTICGSAARIAEQLTDVVARGCRGIVSFGIAGGLVSHVKPGVCVVARSIVTDTERHHAHSEWSQRLLQLIPGAIHADIAHSPVAISTAGHKQDLARTTGAAIVDMESGLAARVAAENKLPFAALRVVADPHDRALPPAAQIPLRHDGTLNLVAVMFSVMAQPRQIGSLIRVGRDTGRARAALTYSRQFIGTSFGFDAAESATFQPSVVILPT
jgi:adenosylhomocysteine nucleosidase